MRSLLKATVLTAISASLLLLSCESDRDNIAQTGKAEFKITDTPVIDPTIAGIYVTISDVQVNGKSIPDFQRRTINLKDYEDGNTAVLGSALLMATTHSSLTLVLDPERDDSGGTPGCYVKTVTDDTKYPIESTEPIRVVLDNSWTVRPNTTSAVVLDFDVRRAIVSEENGTRRFSFASRENLQSSIRIINENEAGSVSGTLHRTDIDPSEKVLVYAYRKGSFNIHTETEPEREDKMMFVNAVTSTGLKREEIGETFTLDFLQKGDYELYFARYTTDDNAVFKGLVDANISSGATTADVVSVPSGFPAYVVVTEVSTLPDPARHP